MSELTASRLRIAASAVNLIVEDIIDREPLRTAWRSMDDNSRTIAWRAWIEIVEQALEVPDGPTVS